MVNGTRAQDTLEVSRLQVIVGSTRPTRAADRVLDWVVDRARAHGTFEVEVLDLRDWQLPIFAEHFGTIGDFLDPTYSDPIVKRWNAKLKEAEGYLFVTPEYNHSISGVLKNAIDGVFVSWAFRNKPFIAVGYSGGIAGGVRAIEHLAQIAIEAELIPLRNNVIVPHVMEAFDETGAPTNPVAELSLRIALEDLAWWSSKLAHARSEGELPPAFMRMQAAIAAATEAEGDVSCRTSFAMSRPIGGAHQLARGLYEFERNAMSQLSEVPNIRPGTYTIDPIHSRIGFIARHAMVTKVRGSFNKFSGSGYFDAEDPSKSHLELTIEASSIDTRNADRDAHLRSNDFFAMDEFPRISFVSTAVEAVSDVTYRVTGDLTIKGVTRQVTIDFEYTGRSVDPQGNERIGFEGTTRVNRKEWGVNWNMALEAGGVLVSDQVTLELDVSAVRDAK